MKITCAKLAGAPGGQNRDIHLAFLGLRLQCSICYVTITKPHSASLRSAISNKHMARDKEEGTVHCSDLSCFRNAAQLWNRQRSHSNPTSKGKPVDAVW